MMISKLYAELADVEANPLGELFLPGMSDVRKKRAKQLAFMLLLMHTKNRAHETERSSEWTGDLETISGRVGAGEQRSMSSDADAIAAMSREAEVKPWRSGISSTAVWFAEFGHAPGHNQSNNTGTQQDSEWCRHVRLSAARLQGYDALKIVWKEKGKGKRKRQKEKQAQKQTERKKQG